MITRRKFLAGTAAALAGHRAIAQHIGGSISESMISRPTFGALRWDAWYSMDPGTAGYDLAVDPGTLAPNKWHFRAPVHAITGDNTISWAGATQESFDNEILAANRFGLDYWVFDYYDPGLGAFHAALNIALSYYMNSKLITKPRFVLMESSSDLGTTGNSSAQIARAMPYIQDPHYMKVKGNRPLIYMYYNSENLATYWNGDIANLRVAIDALRATVQAAGLTNPYIVCLHGGLSSGVVPIALGADCSGRYVGPIPAGFNGTYAAMVAQDSEYWASDAAAFSPYIPTVNVGFDPTPINDNPPSWWAINSKSVIEPTTDELVAHFQNASNFVKGNPTICDANTVLVYSWSECVEGGVAMMPTIGNPTGTKGLALASVR